MLREWSVEFGSHVQGEGADQTVYAPGGLAVLFKESAHQGLCAFDVGLAADDGAAELFRNVFQVVFARFGHGEVVLHAEQNRFMCDFFQNIHLKVAVAYRFGHRHGAVITAGPFIPRYLSHMASNSFQRASQSTSLRCS